MNSGIFLFLQKNEPPGCVYLKKDLFLGGEALDANN
jgi:hypothetical protein